MTLGWWLRLLAGPVAVAALFLGAKLGRLPRRVDDVYAALLIFVIPFAVGVIYGLERALRPAGGWLGAAVAPWPSVVLLSLVALVLGAGRLYVVGMGLGFIVASLGALVAFAISRQVRRVRRAERTSR